jgi:hypothetical protein
MWNDPLGGLGAGDGGEVGLSQLLCIFPRAIFFGSKRGVRKSVNEQTLERLGKVKHAFQGTPWSLALAHIAQPQDLFAMTFAPSGTIHAVRCRYYTKDAFDLAAQIAHLLIEDSRKLTRASPQMRQQA